jgi:Ser/Thr protein kinase RdoA (MazF antagonist)
MSLSEVMTEPTVVWRLYFSRETTTADSIEFSVERIINARSKRLSTTEYSEYSKPTTNIHQCMLSSKQLDKNINASTMTTMPSTDEEMRKLLKPACTPREIEEAVRSTFAATEDIAVKILQELDSYDDQNFVAELHGEKVLVKVHNGVESRDFLRSFHESGDEYDKCSSVIHLQSAIMKQLQSSGVCTSYPLPAKNGLPLAICSLPVVSEVHSPTTLVIKVLSWVPGRTMVSFPALPIEALYHAGIYLGQVDASLDKLDTTKHPSAHRFHAWDGKNTLELRNFVQYIDDANRRALVQSILQTFETEIINSGDCNKFRTGVLHGDYNDANILVNADTFQVAGAIDFGDSVAR